ncbi:MAG: tripartite tricarboxylate transporter permease [Candidatus Diapherotrites archaeon]|nr:tripartite tricarboxylate transporter permease [Candidatus Diapherotrites archaeon]
MLEWMLAGCALGILTGLIPGLHPNTLAAMALLLPISNEHAFNACIGLACMNVVHAFMECIPSIFTGIPNTDTLSAALPGHRMALNGKGLHAIACMTVGGFTSGLASLAFFPLYGMFIEKTWEWTRTLIPFLLALTLGALVLDRKKWKEKVNALICVSASGFLGWMVLRETPIQEPLLPLITGLFGAGTLASNLHGNHSLPVQKTPTLPASTGLLANGLKGCLAGSAVSLVPALSASEAALMVQKISPTRKQSNYLALSTGIAVSNTLFSFAALQYLNKPRSGTAVAIQKIIELNAEQFTTLSIALAGATAVGGITLILIAPSIAALVQRIPLNKTNAVLLVFLSAMVYALSGTQGLIVFGASALVGMLPSALHCRKSTCMAALLVPTLYYYLV